MDGERIYPDSEHMYFDGDAHRWRPNSHEAGFTAAELNRWVHRFDLRQLTQEQAEHVDTLIETLRRLDATRLAREISKKN